MEINGTKIKIYNGNFTYDIQIPGNLIGTVDNFKHLPSSVNMDPSLSY